MQPEKVQSPGTHIALGLQVSPARQSAGSEQGSRSTAGSGKQVPFLRSHRKPGAQSPSYQQSGSAENMGQACAASPASSSKPCTHRLLPLLENPIIPRNVM